MINKSNIEIIYDFIKANNNKAFTIFELYNKLENKLNHNGKDKFEVINDLYTDLIFDNKFALTVDNKWTIKNSKIDNVKEKYIVSAEEATDEINIQDFEETNSEFEYESLNEK